MGLRSRGVTPSPPNNLPWPPELAASGGRPDAPARLPAASGGRDADGYPSHRQILVVMGGLTVDTFLSALDQIIVATALPRIVSELGGLERLAPVVTAPPADRHRPTSPWRKISDLYGRRLLFQVAILTFVAGSLLAGFSQNIEQPIAFRAEQGRGGGGLIALAMATIGDVIPPRERGRYPGYFATTTTESTDQPDPVRRDPVQAAGRVPRRGHARHAPGDRR